MAGFSVYALNFSRTFVFVVVDTNEREIIRVYSRLFVVNLYICAFCRGYSLGGVPFAVSLRLLLAVIPGQSSINHDSGSGNVVRIG